MEAEISKFQATPASTLEEGDVLLRLLLRMHPANDVRWKAIQATWKRCSTIERSSQWLKNRAKKLEAEDLKRSKDDAATKSTFEKRPNPSSGAEPDKDRALKDLVIMALDHQLEHGGSGASGKGLMGAMAQAFGDSFDDQAFHTACEFGRLRNIQQLKKGNNIDVNFRCNDGSTPLLIAMKNKHLEVCNELLEMDGIDLDCRWVGNGCDTPLILAVRLEQEVLVEKLLSKRANVDIQSSTGDTALHKVAISGNARLSRLLLEAAACACTRNRKGATACEVAVQFGHDEVAEQLFVARSSPPVHKRADQPAPADHEASDEVLAIRAKVDTHLASHKLGSAHACVAEWAAQADGRSEIGWHLQQICFQMSPFVWQHHKGLTVEKCQHGFGMKTMLSIKAHELILAECAAVPWTREEVHNPDWVLKYLSGKEQYLHTLSEDEQIPLIALLDGLWPRTSADLEKALATLPEVVQKFMVNAETSAQEPMGISRSSCNSFHDGTHLSVSFVNHSCIPNCEIRGRYHVQIFATRDIEIGEELTVSYLKLNNLLQPQPIRSQLFKDTWGSACTCARCICGSGECRDDSFYSKMTTVQEQLHAVSAADFLPLALQMLPGGPDHADASWKKNLTHLVLQDAVQNRLQQSEWQATVVSSQKDGLSQLLEALLTAFSTLNAIVGESKLLKPLCQTVLQVESLHGKAGGALLDDLAASLQQVRSLHHVFPVT